MQAVTVNQRPTFSAVRALTLTNRSAPYRFTIMASTDYEAYAVCEIGVFRYRHNPHELANELGKRGLPMADAHELAARILAQL